MEPNFQTSFIPKKPMIEERVTTSRPVGIFMVSAIFLLFAILLGSGGLYFYKGVLNKNIAQMNSDLNLAKNRFEPAKIAQLQVLDKRLRAATQVLGKHIAISPIFKAMGELILPTVRFTKFSYSFDDTDTGNVKVKIKGIATGYRAVALQADLFTKNKNIIDPVFSDLVLDDKGNVVFDLDFSVDPVFVDYEEILKTGSKNTTTTSAIESDTNTAINTPSTTEPSGNISPSNDSPIEVPAIDDNDLNL